MSKLRVGIIGTGKKKERPDVFGYAMAYAHANAFNATGQAEVVACADINADNAKAFADTYGVTQVYADYHDMLAEANLDMVAICTWISLHEQMVLDTIAAGIKGIHCEKPMAHTFGGARRMTAAAEAAGCELTFNHQRRYGEAWVQAKELLDSGAIGKLERLESDSNNILDTGTHFIDLFSMFNGETPAKWVIGQIDYRQENKIFGTDCENHQVVMFEYQNGVFGLVTSNPTGSSPVGCFTKLIGSDGVIMAGAVGGGPALKYRLAGEREWTVVEGLQTHGWHFYNTAIADVVDCFRAGRPCQLRAQNAIIATEIIYAAYESSRRRARIDLPLNIDDHPLVAMCACGDLRPEPQVVPA